MRECRVAFDIEDSDASIEQLLSCIAPAYEAIEPREAFSVNLTHCRFLGPTAVVVLVGLKQLADRAGVRSRFVRPGGERPAQFCWFNGIEQRLLVGGLQTVLIPDCVTVPVDVFETVNMGATFAVLHLVKRFLNVDEDSRHALETCIFETLNNIHDHAQSQIGGLMSLVTKRGSARYVLRSSTTGSQSSAACAMEDCDARRYQPRSKWASIRNASKRHGTNLGQGLETLMLLAGTCNGSRFSCSPDAEASSRGAPTGALFALPECGCRARWFRSSSG